MKNTGKNLAGPALGSEGVLGILQQPLLVQGESGCRASPGQQSTGVRLEGAAAGQRCVPAWAEGNRAPAPLLGRRHRETPAVPRLQRPAATAGHVCACVCVCAHVGVRGCVCMGVRMCACVCMCVYVCACVHMCVQVCRRVHIPAGLPVVLQQERGQRQGSQLQVQGGLSQGGSCLGLVKHPDGRKTARRGLRDPLNLCLGVRLMPLTPHKEAEHGAAAPARAARSRLPLQFNISLLVRGALQTEGWERPR